MAAKKKSTNLSPEDQARLQAAKDRHDKIVKAEAAMLAEQQRQAALPAHEPIITQVKHRDGTTTKKHSWPKIGICHSSKPQEKPSVDFTGDLRKRFNQLAGMEPPPLPAYNRDYRQATGEAQVELAEKASKEWQAKLNAMPESAKRLSRGLATAPILLEIAQQCQWLDTIASDEHMRGQIYEMIGKTIHLSLGSEFASLLTGHKIRIGRQLQASLNDGLALIMHPAPSPTRSSNAKVVTIKGTTPVQKQILAEWPAAEGKAIALPMAALLCFKAYVRDSGALPTKREIKMCLVELGGAFPPSKHQGKFWSECGLTGLTQARRVAKK